MIEIDENKKRVVIQDDDQVVVYNDNARIDTNGTTSRIEGYYLIDAESVMKLCALQNDITYLRVNEFWIGRNIFFSITKHDDFDAKIKEIKEYIERRLKSKEDYEEKIQKLKNRIFALEYQIEKFNSSRHWWEHKLKINE